MAGSAEEDAEKRGRRRRRRRRGCIARAACRIARALGASTRAECSSGNGDGSVDTVMEEDRGVWGWYALLSRIRCSLVSVYSRMEDCSRCWWCRLYVYRFNTLNGNRGRRRRRRSGHSFVWRERK